MSILQAIILGIIQGLTEFLPVSSSGHLVLFQRIMGIEEPALFFNIAVHFATLVAVCMVFRKELLDLAKKPVCPLMGYLIAATIPAALAALLFRDQFAMLHDTGLSLGLGFLVTSGAVFLSTRFLGGSRGLENMKIGDAFLIGAAQAVAILPGVSRSGMTLATGLARKFRRKDAVRFSFLLSVPAILGATLMEGVEVARHGLGTIDILPVLAGMAAAGVSGYFAITLFMQLLIKGRIMWFALYTAVLAVLVLADQLFFGLVFKRLF